jgi:hypothetical protein
VLVSCGAPSNLACGASGTGRRTSRAMRCLAAVRRIGARGMRSAISSVDSHIPAPTAASAAVPATVASERPASTGTPARRLKFSGSLVKPPSGAGAPRGPRRRGPRSRPVERSGLIAGMRSAFPVARSDEAGPRYFGKPRSGGAFVVLSRSPAPGHPDVEIPPDLSPPDADPNFVNTVGGRTRRALVAFSRVAYVPVALRPLVNRWFVEPGGRQVALSRQRAGH